MTAKEKAKELVYKYENLVNVWDCRNDEPIELKHKLQDMKVCALICVEEMLMVLWCNHDANSEKMYRYFKKVKQEIIKL
mgnify:CR=1 FL=1